MLRVVISVFAFFFIIHSGRAANVVWNAITIEQDAVGGYCISYPCITMTATVAGDYIVLSADPFDYMEISSSWISAERGDVVTVDSVKRASSYFYAADFWTGEDENVRTDYSIILQDGDSAYFAMISRTYTAPTHYDTAWLELRYDAGILYANSSAIDYDGEALLIGAIPEPSSACLMLIGLSALALRRKQGDR